MNGTGSGVVFLYDREGDLKALADTADGKIAMGADTYAKVRHTCFDNLGLHDKCVRTMRCRCCGYKNLVYARQGAPGYCSRCGALAAAGR